MTSILLSARDEKWPWDDLGGRPQMTSILLSACDEKFMAFEVVIWPLRSLYGLGGQCMALEVNIWPWDDL